VLLLLNHVRVATVPRHQAAPQPACWHYGYCHQRYAQQQRPQSQQQGAVVTDPLLLLLLLL
jgi:hypothetical protein